MLIATWYVLGDRVPSSVAALDLLLTLLFCGMARVAPRLARERVNPAFLAAIPVALRRLIAPRARGPERRILIVGAGDAGESLVREMSRNEALGYLPVGFVDDDRSKLGLRLHGVKVRGGRTDIPRLVAQHDVQEILIAIPSATADQVRPIVEICRGTGAKMKILPDLASLVHGPVRLSDIRDLQIEDLLGRPRVELKVEEVSAYLRGRRVLITGAGGSIGSELCRQVLRFKPSQLGLLGRGENSIFAIFQELSPRADDTQLVEIIGDVINKRKLMGVFQRFRPEIVFHAGADKHVPLMELNPDEAVLNNILGTRNVLEACDEFGVERLVCISTDKAVNPTSVMGCCKRVAEMYIQSGRYRHTVVAAVRFGNVLGSRGSVIPLFQRQIERGGPVTVTHKEVRRYFMTIPEAVALVIQAGTLAKGGEIFVLDMGEPMRIDELARKMIRLHGLEPDQDIPVVYVGLRPGEKLNEELSGEREQSERTVHPKISKVVARDTVPAGPRPEGRAADQPGRGDGRHGDPRDAEGTGSRIPPLPAPRGAELGGAALAVLPEGERATMRRHAQTELPQREPREDQRALGRAGQLRAPADAEGPHPLVLEGRREDELVHHDAAVVREPVAHEVPGRAPGGGRQAEREAGDAQVVEPGPDRAERRQARERLVERRVQQLGRELEQQAHGGTEPAEGRQLRDPRPVDATAARDAVDVHDPLELREAAADLARRGVHDLGLRGRAGEARRAGRDRGAVEQPARIDAVRVLRAHDRPVDLDLRLAGAGERDVEVRGALGRLDRRGVGVGVAQRAQRGDRLVVALLGDQHVEVAEGALDRLGVGGPREAGALQEHPRDGARAEGGGDALGLHEVKAVVAGLVLAQRRQLAGDRGRHASAVREHALGHQALHLGLARSVEQRRPEVGGDVVRRWLIGLDQPQQPVSGIGEHLTAASARKAPFIPRSNCRGTRKAA